MKKVPPLPFYSLIRLTFCNFFFFDSHVFPSCSATNASPLKVWSHPSLNVDLHPHTQCLPPSSPFLSASFPLPAYPLSLFLSFLPLTVYLSIPFLSLSLSFSHRQQRQWSGAVDGASPAGGAGPAAGSDQVHQEGAAVSLSRLQERTSVCPDLLLCSDSITMLYIDLNYSDICAFLCLLLLSRSVPVEWLMRRHSRRSILSSFPKEVRHLKQFLLSCPFFLGTVQKLLSGEAGLFSLCWTEVGPKYLGGSSIYPWPRFFFSFSFWDLH